MLATSAMPRTYSLSNSSFESCCKDLQHCQLLWGELQRRGLLSKNKRPFSFLGTFPFFPQVCLPLFRLIYRTRYRSRGCYHQVDFFRRNASVLDFSSSRGFRLVPAAPWVPFLSIAPYASHAASPLRNPRDQFSLLTATSENAPEVPAVPTIVPSYEDVVWGDDTSFEWDVRQVPENTVVEGFTTRAVEAAAVGPQPQDRQLVMVLPTERLDLEQGAVVGVARAVMWWVPGSPEYCKLVNRKDANLGTLGSLKQQQLVNVLAAFIEDGLFPIDPKRVPACINEIQQLVDRGVIRQSMSPWAAQCLCVKKKDGTLRLCIDWRELNKLLVSDSGGLGDMQTTFDGLKGKRYFSQLDLACGFHRMEITEKDRYKTAFRDADGMLWGFTRAGFGLTVLPAAFTRRVKSALGHLSGVFN
ncbi:unnamed protein product [Ectocarpus sp. CCAP 1310/34]|nr:unnamed protein product [Ectocarpus sp. CCAP 1310/34]